MNGQEKKWNDYHDNEAVQVDERKWSKTDEKVRFKWWWWLRWWSGWNWKIIKTLRIIESMKTRKD